MSFGAEIQTPPLSFFNRCFCSAQESNLLGQSQPANADPEHQLQPETVLAERAGIEPAKDGFIRPLLVL